VQIKISGMAPLVGLLMAAGVVTSASAGMVKDKHGNVGYDTAAECDAAVRAGTATFYTSFTHKPPLKRAGEVSVKAMTLADVGIPQSVVDQKGFGTSRYQPGACDPGAARSGGRDGVAAELQGKYVPFSPAMAVNVYYDKAGKPVRVSMKQCDNWFGGNFPRPIPAPVVAAKPAAAPPAPPAAPPAAAVPPPPPAAAAPVTPAPVAPVSVKAAVAGATGGISTGTILIGVGALVGLGALINNDGDSGTSGTTGTAGTTGAN
jgi:hypothetical protein